MPSHMCQNEAVKKKFIKTTLRPFSDLHVLCFIDFCPRSNPQSEKGKAFQLQLCASIKCLSIFIVAGMKVLKNLIPNLQYYFFNNSLLIQ